jgi:hypothetical protein
VPAHFSKSARSGAPPAYSVTRRPGADTVIESSFWLFRSQNERRYNRGTAEGGHPPVNAGSVTESNFTAYRYIHVDGKAVVSQGLLNRREAEYQMYSGGGP